VQVVILAGGLGTRLRPVTERVPKPMVEVAGIPFLEHILRHLSGQGLHRFLILLGYLGEQITEYFGSGARWGISIEYILEPKPLGTAGAIRNAFDRLDSEFLLLYGDSYLPIDYPEVIREFYASPSKCLMVVYDNHLGDTGVVNNVALGPDGTVRRYQKGALEADLQYVEAGVLCLCRNVFEDLPRFQQISLEQELYGKLIAERQIRAFVTNQRFFDIGTPERLEAFVMRKL
jgi:NDP-sugar pyrophosphorylase family protein